MGYVPLGAVFGFLAVQAGAPAVLVLAASVLVYAGAAQFMMVPMLAAGLPWPTIALATLVVNMRHMFYGLSLLHSAPRQRWARAYLMFALTDETYSVLTALPAGTPPAHWVGVAALNQGWWLLGTSLGLVLGTRAQLDWVGLDFALAALFAVLTVEQWRSARRIAPLGVALLSYALAVWVWPQQALLLAIAACGLAGWFWPPAAPRDAAAASSPADAAGAQTAADPGQP